MVLLLLLLLHLKLRIAGSSDRIGTKVEMLLNQHARDKMGLRVVAINSLRTVAPNTAMWWTLKRRKKLFVIFS